MKQLTLQEKVNKPTCDFCEDTILGEIQFIDYPYRKNRWSKNSLTQICWGCRLLMEDRGIIEEVKD